MREIVLPFGKEKITLAFDKSIKYKIIRENQLPIAKNIKSEIKHAIQNPINCKKITEIVSPDDTVAIIVTDITRELYENIILEILSEELLNKGIKKEKIKIVIATGTHRPNNVSEQIEMFGKYIVDNFNIVNHDSSNSENLIYLGKSKDNLPMTINKEVAQADIKIATGNIEPHLWAGYSGGVKSMSVGVAGQETISATHNLEMLEKPGTRLGIIEKNPFREFLTEVATTIGLNFIINVIQNGRHEVIKVVAGDPQDAFEEGVKIAKKLCEVPIEDKADIIVSCPVHPKDRDLYQASRAINNIIFGPNPIINKGGTIIIPSKCQDGIGHPDIYKNLSSYKNPEEFLQWIHKKSNLSSGDIVSYKICRGLKIANIVFTNCNISKNELNNMGFQCFPNLQIGFNDTLKKYKNPVVIFLPHGTLSLPILKN